MSVELVLDATLRSEQGKGASRRLRREKKVPAILYGAGKEAKSLTLDEEQILRLMRTEAFFSQILDVKVDGRKAEQVILKDLQRHPFKPLVTHMDLLRIRAGEKMRQTLPLHFLNQEEAKGVKTGGGVVHHDVIEVEVECLPKDLPEYLEIDILNLDVDEALHLSDLTLPKGVTLTQLDEEHDPAIVSVHVPRVAIEDVEAEEAAEGEETGAEGEQADDSDSGEDAEKSGGE